VGVWEHTDSWLGVQMGSVLKPIQTLEEFFLCHVYCAYLGTPWYQIVGASRTVSNRESRYPLPNSHMYSQSHLGWHFRKLKAQSYHVSFTTFQWKETFELWALSFERALEHVTPSRIGCTYARGTVYVNGWVPRSLLKRLIWKETSSSISISILVIISSPCLICTARSVEDETRNLRNAEW